MFGEVVEGMDVVFAIEADDPIDSVRIVRVGDSAEAFRPDTDSFRRLAAEVRQRVRAEETERRLREDEFVRENWPGLETMAGELLTTVLKSFSLMDFKSSLVCSKAS